jgi:hypothetical protein
MIDLPRLEAAGPASSGTSSSRVAAHGRRPSAGELRCRAPRTGGDKPDTTCCRAWPGQKNSRVLQISRSDEPGSLNPCQQMNETSPLWVLDRKLIVGLLRSSDPSSHRTILLSRTLLSVIIRMENPPPDTGILLCHLLNPWKSRKPPQTQEKMRLPRSFWASRSRFWAPNRVARPGNAHWPQWRCR